MAPTAYIRFYAELNDFLSLGKKQATFAHNFKGAPTVKDLIESLGAPHTEVDLILVNGISADFSQQVQDGDRISVYPVFEALDISPILQVRPEPLREPCFVLDTHLGKLASYLRMLGFDAWYSNNYKDEELASISANNHRILLTRDRGLLKRSNVTHGYLVRADDPKEQVTEVLQRFDLTNQIRPFLRCMRCNRLLKPVPEDEARRKVPPRVRQQVHDYKSCPGCRRIYWKGSHYERMVDFICRVITTS